ncbi:MAG: YibE/F family protein [Candidatus Levybacteria bacterium]|nr:YibE/F family protein [Candidatus Levybacteria bacterium]
MNILIKTFLLVFIAALFPQSTLAQSQSTQEFSKAKVTSIIKNEVKNIGGKKNPYQKVTVQILDGAERNKILTLEYGGVRVITESQRLSKNDTVILSKLLSNNKSTYTISDIYRIPSLLFIASLFFILVILMTGKKGLGSLLGLIISLIVIAGFIVPQILKGADPLTISVIGSIIIMITTIYLAHGYNQRTTIAVIATAISLFLTGVIAIIAVKLSSLSGLGSEDAYNLMLGSQIPINLHGLLLGGIIIGSLGVLDDTTTTQSTTVAELSDANPSYSMKELYRRGMIVGREHIASLVNTLVLAYAGAGIAIFIFIVMSLQSQQYPWWVIFNSELLAEEIVRTIAGSIGLVLAVPITTLLAAFLAKNEIKIK